MGLLSALVLLSTAPQITDAEALFRLRKIAVPIRTVEVKGDYRDLEPLRKSIGDSKIVGLGEATHGSREIFQMKHRLFTFLVERMGFTVIALESSMPQTMAMDEYVTHGKGDLDAAVKGQGFWTLSTEEVRDLMRWMRAYNLDPKHKQKLHVVGIDMQDKFPVWQQIVEKAKEAGIKDPALEEENWFFTQIHSNQEEAVFQKVHEWTTAGAPILREKHGEAEAKVFERLETVFRQAWVSGKKAVAQESFLDEHRGTDKKMSELSRQATEVLGSSPPSTPDALWGLQILSRWEEISKSPQTLAKEGVTARRLSRAQKAVRSSEKGEEFAQGLDYLEKLMDFIALPVLSPRDLFMADNLEWIQKSFAPGSKVVLWAHNSHVGRSRMSGQPLMLGSYLEDRYKSAYFPLGFVFNEGGFRAIANGGSVGTSSFPPAKPGSFDALLADVGQPRFFLDVDRADPALKTWLRSPRPWRNIGSSYNAADPDSHYETLNPAELFRGLIYLDKLTAAKPL
ncbi:erythromycin esterase family protein [bacterium]|nr:MAG: erythromycin esterase family protein [bacterium]